MTYRFLMDADEPKRSFAVAHLLPVQYTVFVLSFFAFKQPNQYCQPHHSSQHWYHILVLRMLTYPPHTQAIVSAGYRIPIVPGIFFCCLSCAVHVDLVRVVRLVFYFYSCVCVLVDADTGGTAWHHRKFSSACS